MFALEETPAMETIMRAERIPTMTITTSVSIKVCIYIFYYKSPLIDKRPDD